MSEANAVRRKLMNPWFLIPFVMMCGLIAVIVGYGVYQAVVRIRSAWRRWISEAKILE
jgi:hypothetical protein